MIEPGIGASLKRTGITEERKAKLDALTLHVLDAEHDIDQNQAIVTSLTEKLNNFQRYLADADTERAQALANKNAINQLVQRAFDLQNNSSIAFDGMVQADQQIKALATQVTDVMNKLVYSAKLINKFANSIVRKKAVNPLISHELVGMVGTAGTNATNAVALTLVALRSIFEAQTSAIGSEQVMALEYLQARELLKTLTGLSSNEIPKDGVIPVSDNNHSLYALLYFAYETATNNYETANAAMGATQRQLNNAQAILNRSQVKLKSLQAGLAAANAAVLAS